MNTHPVNSPTTIVTELKESIRKKIIDIDAIQQERDRYRKEIETLSARNQELREAQERALIALRHIFPYSAYREKRRDLESLDEPGLVHHFIEHGINEGVDLTSESLEEDQRKLRCIVEEATSKADFYQQKSLRTAAQLDLLNDIIAKLLVAK